MLTAAIVVPATGALVMVLLRGRSEGAARGLAVAVAAVPLVLLVAAWFRFDLATPGFQLVESAPWIPSLGIAYTVGVDGMSLALAVMSSLLFLAAVAYPTETQGRAHAYYGWFLFLEAVSLGLFLALDLLLFYICFDLSLVGMYFLIARWGHGDPQQAATKFFLYTLLGSLVMLLGLLAVVLANDPITFHIPTIIERQPLAGAGHAGLVLLAFVVGFGVKTPVVPVHTWLPPAHVDAPGPASTILAGVLLKMGTYGLVRLPLSMMRETFARYALLIAVVAVVSILYGALVAFGQGHLKRRIAYTSVNHMGYAVLGIAVAGAAVGDQAARSLALTGAVLEMVAHGLVTGVLFLIAGSFWRRGREYDLDAYGGLAGPAPALTAATGIAAFASLGLPGLAQFVAEFQIFAGALAVYPVLAGIGLLGILITAALFLQLLQKLFFGALPERWRDFRDLLPSEAATLGVLLVLVVIIGVAPGWLVDLVHGAAEQVVAGP